MFLGLFHRSACRGWAGPVSTVQEIPRLHLFVDIDLVGDPLTCKSHSGHFVVLRSPNGTESPVLWGSKRQACVSRSPAEGQIVSAATLVFEDGIPLKHVLETLTGELSPPSFMKIIPQLCKS